jgi:hypothetical protein
MIVFWSKACGSEKEGAVADPFDGDGGINQPCVCVPLCLANSEEGEYPKKEGKE